MEIQEKNSFNTKTSSTLKSLVNKKIASITDQDISDKVDSILSEISNLDRGQEYSNILQSNKKIETQKSLINYITQGAQDIINYVEDLMLTQFAIFNLVLRGKLMPLHIRKDTQVEVNIEYDGGNTLFDFYFDLYPYNTFLII